MSGALKITDELLMLGVKKGLIDIKGDRIEYIAQRKTYNFVELKEQLRARTYVKLVLSYRYQANRIGLDVAPVGGASGPLVDIVVYEDGGLENPYIIVEVKPTSENQMIETAKREGLVKADLFNVQFLLVVCDNVEIVYNLATRSSLETLERYRIPTPPTSYGEMPEYRYKKASSSDASKATLDKLAATFQHCFETISGGGRMEPLETLDEMCKLLFAKIYDERFTKFGVPYRFQVGDYENSCTVARRVRGIYEDAQKEELGVFTEEMEVSDEVIFEVVKGLEEISLARSEPEAKSKAFEGLLHDLLSNEFAWASLPPEILDFVAKMLDTNERQLVIDTTCGSGTFLLRLINLIQERIREKYAGHRELIEAVESAFCRFGVFGIEADGIARIAKINLMLHHLPQVNVMCSDILDDYKKFDPKWEIAPGKYEIAVANPSFTMEKRKGILKNFELGSKVTKRNHQRREILLLERCLELLKLGGKACIILPDDTLEDPSFQYLRNFIDREAKILAIISLSPHMPVSSYLKSKASMVLLQKKERGHDLGDYPIFIAHIDQMDSYKDALSKLLKKYREFYS